MPVYFEIDNKSFDYTLQIIPLSDASNLDQAELLKNIAVYIGNLKTRYENDIKRAGKILGQERIKFVEITDKLLTLLMTLLDSIKNNFSNDIQLSEKNINLKIPIENRNKKFYSDGNLKEEDINNFNKFEKAHTVIVNNLKIILLKYREMMSKSNPNTDIYKVLLTAFDDVFYNLIILRHNIKNCIIDK